MYEILDLIHDSGLIIAPYNAFADVQSNHSISGPRRMIA